MTFPIWIRKGEVMKKKGVGGKKSLTFSTKQIFSALKKFRRKNKLSSLPFLFPKMLSKYNVKKIVFILDGE